MLLSDEFLILFGYSEDLLEEYDMVGKGILYKYDFCVLFMVCIGCVVNCCYCFCCYFFYVDNVVSKY